MTESAIAATQAEKPKGRRRKGDTALLEVTMQDDAAANADALEGQEAPPEAPQAAPSPIPGVEGRPCYRVLDDWHEVATGHKYKPGTWYFGIKEKAETLPDLIERWICSPLHVDAVTTDEQEGNYGRLLRFRSTLGTWKTWAMPMAMLAGDGNELRAALLSQGVELDPEARSSLSRYLQGRTPAKRMRCALQTGWADSQYRAFVLPDEVIGPAAGGVVFQSGEADGHEYTKAGTLDGWRDGVAALAVGNPVLMLALCAAFAGPVLARCNAESGGLHFVGDSSTGKTTALQAACSVWGGESYRRSWRATANGMEGAAATFNDGLLGLDEISECDPRDVGAIVYSLGNGRGKQRASRTGTARSVTRWRCCIVSTGETTIEAAMQEGGHRVKAGQAVRMLDIRVQRQYGAWDSLHGHHSGNAFSDSLKRAAGQHYGHAGRAFLQRLTREQDSSFTEALEAIKAMPEFASHDADGQVKRGAARFALLALAGELATDYGITGWEEGAAIDAASTLFAAWRANRGGAGANLEQEQIRAAVLAFIEAHGASRFQDMGNPDAIVYNRAGWRQEAHDGIRYLFTSGGLKEATKGFDMQRATAELVRCGALPAPGADGKRSELTKIDGEAKRVYRIDATKLTGGNHGDT